jgi:DnaJ homolog subfamily A member 1
MRCVTNEGMPIHRSPFDKGRLIIAFTVNFPPNNFVPADKLVLLEKLLPPRVEMIIPDDAEDVALVPFNPEAEKRRAQEAHDSDDDDRQQGQRVQCATH